MPEKSYCRGDTCGSEILWIVSSKTGKKVPVDPKQITIITSLGEYVKGYVPHHITCPDRDQFRR